MTGASVKVGNVSLKASEKDLWDFFAFAGEIQSVQVEKGAEGSTQSAYITFVDEKALDTALLLDGAVVIDRPLAVERAVGYEPPAPQVPLGAPTAAEGQPAKPRPTTDSAAGAQEMVSSLLAKGYVLSKDTMANAKSFDEKHQLSKTAYKRATALGHSAQTTAASLDERMGISHKVTVGAASVSQSIRGVDERYGVSVKSREAFASAEATVNEAAARVLKNPYVASGASWLTASFSRASKAASEIGQKVREKATQQAGQPSVPSPAEAVQREAPKEEAREATEVKAEAEGGAKAGLGEGAGEPVKLVSVPAVVPVEGEGPK